MTEGTRERREQAETFVRDFGRVLFEGSGGDEHMGIYRRAGDPCSRNSSAGSWARCPARRRSPAQPVWASRCCCARPRDACTPRGD